MRQFEVGEFDLGVRTDLFVAAMYTGYSRSSLDSLFNEAAVLVNGQKAKPGYKLRRGDKVSVDDSLLHKAAPAIKLPIIYEDQDVVVINKPTGVLTHSKGALNLEATVASFIKPKLTDKNIIGSRAGIVHRLDRGTSGVIITAKNQSALKWLQKQFSTRKVKKTYLAVVEGLIDPAEALIEVPIRRNPKRPQTFMASSRGKSALTGYKLIKTFTKNGKQYSLVELKPETGRTHQIRVHLAYINHPIVGDLTYGHGDGQLLLHAKSLELTLPGSVHKSFSADTPSYFEEFISNG